MAFDGQRYQILEEENPDPAVCAAKNCGRPRPRKRRICLSCSSALWKRNNPHRRYWFQVRTGARSRGLSFKLPFPFFVELALRTKLLESDFHLDRIDARRGYEVDNVRVIEASENLRKAAKDKRVINGEEDYDNEPF